MGRRVRSALLVAVCGFGGGPGAVAQATPSALVFVERHAQFGDRYQGSTVEHRYVFSNNGSATVTVVDTFVVDGTGEITVTPRTIPPRTDGVALLRQPLDGQLGRSAFRYALITDEPGVDRYRFTLSGFVQSAYDPETLSIEFGVVDRSVGGTADAELSSREVPALEVRPAGDLPDFLRLDLDARAGPAGQGRRIRATMSPGVAPGLVAGSFLLGTNVSHHPEIRVYYRANVVGDVVPSENPLQLGATRIGEVLRKEVRLESKTGRPFEVERVDDSSETFEWSVAPCADGEPTCRRLVLSFKPEVPLTLVGKLQVHVAGEDDPITLNYRGIVVTEGTVIKKIEAPGGPDSRGR